jgi:transposase
VLSVDDEPVVLRMLCDGRDGMSKAKAQVLNRMHRLLTELILGGVPKKKSVTQSPATLVRILNRRRAPYRSGQISAGQRRLFRSASAGL